MNNKNERSDNRKAFPQFIKILLVCMLGGGVLGVLGVMLGRSDLPETLSAQIIQLLTRITPYSIWVLTAGLALVELILYRRAKGRFLAWDGEEETSMERAEEQLSWVLLLSSLNLIINFFLFSLSHLIQTTWDISLLIAGFVLSLAAILFAQQKTVDLTRKMNPEKQGSIYDMKFQQKWMASCDENEQRQIGQAAYKTITVLNYTCAILFLVLMLMSNFYDIGVLPMFLVMLIWGICQVTYTVECIRLNRHHR